MRKCKHESHRDAVNGTRRDFCVGMVPSSALHLRHASEFDLNYGLIERVAESRRFFHPPPPPTPDFARHRGSLQGKNVEFDMRK